MKTVITKSIRFNTSTKKIHKHIDDLNYLLTNILDFHLYRHYTLILGRSATCFPIQETEILHSHYGRSFGQRKRQHNSMFIYVGTHRIMVIVGSRLSYLSSNPGWSCLHLTMLIPLRKVWIQLFSFLIWVNSRAG